MWSRLLFAPVMLTVIPFAIILVTMKLPMMCCERLRAVRWLPVAGLSYYSAGITTGVLLGLELWWVPLLIFAAFGGDWLLPDPLTFVFKPAQRRAVRRALDFVERQGGPRPLYGRVRVISSEPGRLIVLVAVESGFRRPDRRFFAVGEDGKIEELGFDYVHKIHNIRAWRR